MSRDITRFNEVSYEILIEQENGFFTNPLIDNGKRWAIFSSYDEAASYAHAFKNAGYHVILDICLSNDYEKSVATLLELKTQ